MSKEKQIIEMAKICCNTCEFGCGFNGECDLDNDYRKCGISNETAETLYDAGYRKAIVVVRDIFNDLNEMWHKGRGVIGYSDLVRLERLHEQKYTEENL